MTAHETQLTIKHLQAQKLVCEEGLTTSQTQGFPTAAKLFAQDIQEINACLDVLKWELGKETQREPLTGHSTA